MFRSRLIHPQKLGPAGRRRRSPTGPGLGFIPSQVQKRGVCKLILLRHGQSVWNGKGQRFTGWCDVPLTVQGRVEAVAAGQLLRARGFDASKVDVAFTSELQVSVVRSGGKS